MVQVRFPQSSLSQFPSASKKGTNKFSLKQCGKLCCNGAKNPQKHCPPFLVGCTQFFGKNLARNVARVPECCCHACTTMAGLATSWTTSLLSTKNNNFLKMVYWRVLETSCTGCNILGTTSATGRVVEELVTATSSAAFSASVNTGLCIINVPYVAFEDLVDSSLSTLTVTFFSHVTVVLSPTFSADSFFTRSTSLL